RQPMPLGVALEIGDELVLRAGPKGSGPSKLSPGSVERIFGEFRRNESQRCVRHVSPMRLRSST
ncbi:hypothetical protein, partial [Sinorhizobium fredii]|uniref:hypothetical protein n=1 Tax=Rhizobium fredii TaxID=380 RepID=UPI001AEBF6BF